MTGQIENITNRLLEYTSSGGDYHITLRKVDVIAWSMDEDGRMKVEARGREGSYTCDAVSSQEIYNRWFA